MTRKHLWILLALAALCLLLLPSASMAEQPLQATVTLSADTVAAGGSLTATVEATGGTGEYRYWITWHILDGEAEYTMLPDPFSTANSQSLAVKYGQSGYVEASVMDVQNNEVTVQSSPFEITGSQAGQTLTLTLKMSADTVTVGDSLTATAEATGGTKPYTYAFRWSVREGKTSSIFTQVNNSAVNSHTAVIKYGEAGHVIVKVTDALGREVTEWGEFGVTGSPVTEPINVSLALNGTSFKPGDTVTAKATVSGGVAPYSYQYGWYILENGEERGDVSSVPTTDPTSTYLVGYGESGRAAVLVKDAVGRRWVEDASFTITGSTPADPISFTAKLDKEEAAAGTPLTVTVSDVKGGVPPYKYSYYWNKIGQDGFEERFTEEKGSDAPTCAQTMPASTGGAVYVVVTDAQQRTETESLRFTILPSKTPGDADANGRVEIADLQLVVDHIVAEKPLGSKENANAHKDDTIDLQDALAIIHMIVP